MSSLDSPGGWAQSHYIGVISWMNVVYDGKVNKQKFVDAMVAIFY